MSSRLKLALALVATACAVAAMYFGDLHARPMVIHGLGIDQGPSDPTDPGDPGDDDSAEEGIFYKDEFLIPLNDKEGSHFARMSVLIQLKDEAARDALRLQASRLRDAFIVSVAGYSTTDLAGHGGLVKCKKLMRDALRATAPNVSVRAVYFGDFLVQ